MTKNTALDSDQVEEVAHASCSAAVSLNANRHVTGVLRGFDQFMNIVLDNAVDEKAKTDIGMVVSLLLSLSLSLSRR